MKAVKGNREYNITEAEKTGYVNSGFDIVENGKVIAYGKGKTVPYEEYEKLKKELAEEKAGKEEEPKTDIGDPETEPDLDTEEPEEKPVSKRRTGKA